MAGPVGGGEVPEVDVTAAVERVQAALAAYVEAARGSREDGLAGVGALDPREEAAQLDVGAALAGLHEAFASSFGHPPLLEPDWSAVTLDGVGDLEDDGEGDVELAEGEVLSLQFFVGLPGRRARRPVGADDEAQDPWARAYEVVDEAGFAIVSALEEAGYVVPSFASSRGDEDDDEDDED